MELRVVTSTTDFGLANVLKGMLESEGIEAALSGSGLESVYPGTTLSSIDILVRPEDLDRARDLVDQVDTQGFPEDIDDEA
jgi:hypothetical protein